MSTKKRNNTITQQQLREAAQAVASHCLLPDPRSASTQIADAVTSFWRPMHWENLEQCASYEIGGKVDGITKDNAVVDRQTYDRIMRHARNLATEGAKQCQVRDFNDAYVVPKRYFGYRGADNQCHITHDEAEANAARCAYDQFEKPANERLFLPRAPRRANAKGECTP